WLPGLGVLLSGRAGKTGRKPLLREQMALHFEKDVVFSLAFVYIFEAQRAANGLKKLVFGVESVNLLGLPGVISGKCSGNNIPSATRCMTLSRRFCISLAF
ncbi:MAG: hypothetical protein C4554_05880, partial [Dethiobacter sp.]